MMNESADLAKEFGDIQLPAQFMNSKYLTNQISSLHALVDGAETTSFWLDVFST